MPFLESYELWSVIRLVLSELPCLARTKSSPLKCKNLPFGCDRPVHLRQLQVIFNIIALGLEGNLLF